MEVVADTGDADTATGVSIGVAAEEDINNNGMMGNGAIIITTDTILAMNGATRLVCFRKFLVNWIDNLLFDLFAAESI